MSDVYLVEGFGFVGLEGTDMRVDEKDGTYVVLLAINQRDAKTKQFCGRHFLFSRWI